MSRPKNPWWGYVKNMIRLYPKRNPEKLSGVPLREYEAVRKAVESTRKKPDGEDRMKVVELVLFKGTHLVPGAALKVPCSERTAKQWHGDFIREVAKNYGLLE